MTLSLYKYDALGRPLTKDEVDDNWTALEDAINDALSGALPVSAITLVENDEGQFLRFLDNEGHALASVPFPAMLVEAGDWETLVEYTTRHIVIHLGGTYLCRVAHTAASFQADYNSGKWVQLGSSAATSIAFDPGASGLNSVTTQAAIVELADMIGDGLTADRVIFDNTASGLNGTSVQAAIDQLADRPVIDQAADIAVEPTGSVSAANVQAALVELAERIDAGGAGEVAAADVSVSSIVGVTGTTVQAVWEDLKTQIDAAGPGEGGSGSAASTSFDPSGLEAVTSATDVQHALEDVVSALGSGGGGPISSNDVSYPGGGWNIGGTTVQAAIVQIGDQFQALDETLYEFPANRVHLDPLYVDAFYDPGNVTGALNRIASTLTSILATLDDHSTRLTALETA